MVDRGQRHRPCGREAVPGLPALSSQRSMPDRVLHQPGREVHVQKGGTILSDRRRGSSSSPPTLALEFLHRGDVVIHPLQEGVHPRYRRALDGVLRYSGGRGSPMPGSLRPDRALGRRAASARTGAGSAPAPAWPPQTGAVARSPRRWQPLVRGSVGRLWGRFWRSPVLEGYGLVVEVFGPVAVAFYPPPSTTSAAPAAWPDVIHRRPPGMRREAVSTRRLLGTRRAPHRSDRIALWGMAWGTGRIEDPGGQPVGGHFVRRFVVSPLGFEPRT